MMRWTEGWFAQAETTDWHKITGLTPKAKLERGREDDEKDGLSDGRASMGKMLSWLVVVWNNSLHLCLWVCLWVCSFSLFIVWFVFLSMEWCFRRGNKDERERRGGGKRGFRKSYLWFSVRLNVSDCCESLCCRISFISHWCYFVLCGSLLACNGNFGALTRGQVFVLLCVRVCAGVLSSCFRQYLCHGPPLHPHPRSLSASTTVHLARDLVANPLRCVSCNFPLCWDIFVFFCQFFFANFSWMLSGLVQRFVEAFVNSNWAFVVKGFELKSLLLIQHCFSPRKATDTHRKMGASRHNMLALYEIMF